MMNFADKIISSLGGKTLNQKSYPDFSTGDTITISVKVKEGEKERIQLFKGTVMKIQGSGLGRSFTVRKISNSVGVERTWPFASPAIDSIEVNLRGKVRRSRIFYLRGLKGRAARLQTEIVQQEKKSTGKLSKKAKKEKAAETPA